LNEEKKDMLNILVKNRVHAEDASPLFYHPATVDLSMKKVTLVIVLFGALTLFSKLSQAETCPSFHNHSRVHVGGSSNVHCLCPKGFQRGDVRTMFRERGVDLARQCRKARLAAYMRCKKQGRVVQFKSKVLSSRFKVVMGHSRGYCIVRYSCRWAQYKKHYISRSRLTSFRIQRRILRSSRRKLHSCTILWKARLRLEGNRQKSITGRYREMAGGRKLSKQILCKLAEKKARKWLSKRLQSRRYYCSRRP
jgi:hypothetical protein